MPSCFYSRCFCRWSCVVMARWWLAMAVIVMGVVGGVAGECPSLMTEAALDCRTQLQPGQFYCTGPTIDPVTQSALGCRSNHTVLVPCYAAPNVSCGGNGYEPGRCIFEQEEPCRYVKGQRYNYYVAVALSLFLGMFGIDRFYLGYPAIGLVKLCTLGFMFIGQLFDFLLILLQVVGPADRSDYFIPLYGPILRSVNTTQPFLPVSNATCA